MYVDIERNMSEVELFTLPKKLNTSLKLYFRDNND